LANIDVMPVRDVINTADMQLSRAGLTRILFVGGDSARIELRRRCDIGKSVSRRLTWLMANLRRNLNQQRTTSNTSSIALDYHTSIIK